MYKTIKYAPLIKLFLLIFKSNFIETLAVHNLILAFNIITKLLDIVIIGARILDLYTYF
jgi:hypothetical protein